MSHPCLFTESFRAMKIRHAPAVVRDLASGVIQGRSRSTVLDRASQDPADFGIITASCSVYSVSDPRTVAPQKWRFSLSMPIRFCGEIPTHWSRYRTNCELAQRIVVYVIAAKKLARSRRGSQKSQTAPGAVPAVGLTRIPAVPAPRTEGRRLRPNTLRPTCLSAIRSPQPSAPSQATPGTSLADQRFAYSLR